MALSNQIKEKISIEVIKTLVTRFDSFPADASNNRNAPFHEEFLRAFSDKLQNRVSDTPFFISLSSWLHGLNTTLGQTFFEKVAHHLCNGEKREYTSKKIGNLRITETQKQSISSIITDLSNNTQIPDLDRENRFLFQNYTTPLVSALDFSADVFIEDIDSIIAIELKSVKPNSGEMRGEKQKILEGKAALYRQFPEKQIHFYMGFPFDPTVNPATESVTSYDKTRFLGSIINMTKFFAPNETLIASELWDFLSGQTNTMEEILQIINSISTTSFLDKFRQLNDNSLRHTTAYSTLLKDWNLFSELSLVNNDYSLKQKIGQDRALNRIYNNKAFDDKGNYNFNRYVKLNILLN